MKTYKASVSAEGVLGEAQLLAENEVYGVTTASGKLYYFVGNSYTSSGELCVDGNRIDEAYNDGVQYYDALGKVVYFKNYSNSTKDYYIYDGSTSELIKKEIRFAALDNNGTAYYIDDEWNLYMLGEDDKVKLDKNVEDVFMPVMK